MGRFEGKAVVVTGAGSGIGRAVSLAFAREGADVICADLDLATAEATAREVETFGVKGVGLACDVSKAEEVGAMAEAAFKAIGQVDILVNNAGVALSGPVENLTLEDWQWQLGPNLWGVIHGVHAFLPAMLARGQGHIVNLASVAGLVAPGGMAGYVTSKFAVVGLSESLRFELASRGVGVTVVCPGFVATNIFTSARLKGGVKVPLKLLRRVAMKPADLADDILEAVENNRPKLVATGHGKLFVAIKRWAPGLYQRLGYLSRWAVLGRR